MTEFNSEKNRNQKLKKIDCDSKIEFLKNELLNNEKCREFSEKLCDYIKNANMTK